MTAHRFVVSASALEGGRATLFGEQARQIASVLRLSVGDRVVLVVDGEEVDCSLERVSPAAVEARVMGRARSRAEPGVRLALALPVLRGERSEEVVEAVTQLGVARIVPFVSARSVVRELSEAKRERWERIARESAETARRGRVPEIWPLHQWGDLFEALEPPIVIAWEEERDRRLRDALTPTDRLSLVVGPEGGLEAGEVAFARARGATTVTLGRRNLRAETAAIAAVAEAMAALD